MSFPDLLSEREQILCHLERGAIVTVFDAAHGPHKRRMVVHRETMLVVVSRNLESKEENSSVETAIAVSSIREVRKDCEHSKEFERSPAKYYIDRRFSFIVVYDGGLSFEPLTLCCLVESEAEYARWISGLGYLVEEYFTASVKAKREFFVRYVFSELQNPSEEDSGLLGWANFKSLPKKIKRKVSH